MSEGGDFESLALPHLRSVARFALSLARDASDADDLVQETYLLACRGWHTFDRTGDCRRWLFTICRNAFLTARRRQGRVVESDDGDLDAMPAAVAHAAAVGDGLGDLLDRVELGPAIREAIDALPEPHHSILVLVDVEEFSYDEAAAILGIPGGTVRSRLYRARRLVQEALLTHARDAGLVRGGTA